MLDLVPAQTRFGAAAGARTWREGRMSKSVQARDDRAPTLHRLGVCALIRFGSTNSSTPNKPPSCIYPLVDCAWEKIDCPQVLSPL